MTSMVLTMSSPRTNNPAPTAPFKKKTRRAPRKQKKNKKPYFKLTWEEKEQLNERDRKLAEARLASSKISAPNNTTQFLMQEHRTSTPNQTPVGMCYHSDEDGESLSGLSSDEQAEAIERSGLFMENDFAETFESVKADILENKTRSQLIEEIVSLDKMVTNLEKERGKERFSSTDTNNELRDELGRMQEEMSALRRENEKLRAENSELKGGANAVVIPVKRSLGDMELGGGTEERRPPCT